MEHLTTDILVVGGGTGGTAAAIQAARRGINTILVSEFPCLGGMLTTAGVSAPDGLELAPWQTGMWGAYLEALQKKQKGGLAHSWVSMFTYNPTTGSEILVEWINDLPTLQIITGEKPIQVLRRDNRIIGVKFKNYYIEAKITLDGTELGDLLPLGQIPFRWGWELKAEFNEPSAPREYNELTTQYPIQAATWVVIMQDYKDVAPQISPPPNYNPEKYQGAWDNYGPEKFINYGKLPDSLFMINWPIHGNDYGEGVGRLLTSERSRKEFLQEAYWHTQGFAYYIQTHIGKRYGVAKNVLNDGYGFHPYYRESRRLVGLATVTERDILPAKKGTVARLPLTSEKEVRAIAIGNYPNDHHYPGVKFPLKSKSVRWGGRWTGTPFTIPYDALVPAGVEGFLVCDKNISVSHIANGSTRLQPVVMNIGQAAGMAAALCVELNCQPQALPVRRLQEALLCDPSAPAAIIPLFNLPPEHPEARDWQRYYLDYGEAYPLNGTCACDPVDYKPTKSSYYFGTFLQYQPEQYQINITYPVTQFGKTMALITLRPEVNEKLLTYPNGKIISLLGTYNPAGKWIAVDKIY